MAVGGQMFLLSLMKIFPAEIRPSYSWLPTWTITRKRIKKIYFFINDFMSSHRSARDYIFFGLIIRAVWKSVSEKLKVLVFYTSFKSIF